MEHRRFGRSGIEVSTIGARHDDVRRVGQSRRAAVPQNGRHGARCRRHVVRHRRHLRLRRVRGVPRASARRAPRQCRAGHEGRQRDERRPGGARLVAAVDRRSRATRACAGSAPTTSTCTRCTVPTRHADRRDAGRRSTSWSGRARCAQSARRRSRRAARRGQSARRAAGRHGPSQRAAAVLRSSSAAIENEVLPWCRQHDVGVLVWAPLNGGWLTGKYQSDEVDAASRAAREPDTSIIVTRRSAPRSVPESTADGDRRGRGSDADPVGVGVRAGQPRSDVGVDRAAHARSVGVAAHGRGAG